jgi:hypothetical protein
LAVIGLLGFLVFGVLYYHGSLKQNRAQEQADDAVADYRRIVVINNDISEAIRNEKDC